MLVVPTQLYTSVRINPRWSWHSGLEQTFVIASRPGGRGDLIVRGAVSSDLRAEELAATHQSLRFVDRAGQSILEYGAAFAVDARGIRHPMRTSYAGGELRLTLDATVLEQVEFPLTVDPLIGRVDLDRSPSGRVFDAIEMM